MYCYPTDPAQLDRSAAQSRQEFEQEQPAEALEMLFMQGMPAWKRAIDLVGATVGLILLAPLFVILAAAIKLISPGPVLFRQWRRGRGGQPFVMYKFRTMIVDAESLKAKLLALQRARWPGVQNETRSARDAAGTISAEDQHRRAAAIVERANGRNVAGRSAAVALQRGGRLPIVAALRGWMPRRD